MCLRARTLGPLTLSDIIGDHEEIDKRETCEEPWKVLWLFLRLLFSVSLAFLFLLLHNALAEAARVRRRKKNNALKS